MKPNRFAAHAALPPRFVGDHFRGSREKEAPISSVTIHNWAKSGAFGPRAQQVAERGERVMLTWTEVLTAKGAWSTTGDLAQLQRPPYDPVQVAERLGISEQESRERFRSKRIAGGFKLGKFWYARADEFDLARDRML